MRRNSNTINVAHQLCEDIASADTTEIKANVEIEVIQIAKTTVSTANSMISIATNLFAVQLLTPTSSPRN
jgi:hypothetical protein